MLKVTGLNVNAQVVGSLISGESAFVCYWKDVEVRVSHHKGTWVLVKMRGKELCDRLEASDEFEFTTDNPLLHGLVTSFREVEAHDEGDEGGRRRMSRLLTKTIGVWCRPVEEILSVECLQVRRNSWLDEYGEFSFSPDKKL